MNRIHSGVKTLKASSSWTGTEVIKTTGLKVLRRVIGTQLAKNWNFKCEIKIFKFTSELRLDIWLRIVKFLCKIKNIQTMI